MVSEDGDRIFTGGIFQANTSEGKLGLLLVALLQAVFDLANLIQAHFLGFINGNKRIILLLSPKPVQPTRTHAQVQNQTPQAGSSVNDQPTSFHKLRTSKFEFTYK